MNFSAQEIYNTLVHEDQICSLQGQIKFYLGEVNIVVKQRDVVGNIIQEWLQGWLDHKAITYDVNHNTQMPPDFFLNTEDHSKGLLEIKAFNYNASPGFDIADFRMYEHELIEKPFMLDVDYLIFGYVMSDDGIVTISNVWLKKVWEICSSMANFPLNLQVKKGVVHKIRPRIWYTENKLRYPLFSCKEHFLSAIEETVYKNKDTHDEFSAWKDKFLKNYKKHYGITLDIPKWSEIRSLYQQIDD